MSSDDKSNQHALDAVLARAALDLTFRRDLLSDPRNAVHRAFGVTLPADYRVRFIERDRDLDALIVLPDFRSSSDELSESDLESVSGGAATDDLTWEAPPENAG